MAALMFNFCWYFPLQNFVLVLLKFSEVFWCVCPQLRFSVYLLPVPQERWGHEASPHAGRRAASSSPHFLLKLEMRLTSPGAATSDTPRQPCAITGVNRGRALTVQLMLRLSAELEQGVSCKSTGLWERWHFCDLSPIWLFSMCYHLQGKDLQANSCCCHFYAFSSAVRLNTDVMISRKKKHTRITEMGKLDILKVRRREVPSGTVNQDWRMLQGHWISLSLYISHWVSTTCVEAQGLPVFLEEGSKYSFSDKLLCFLKQEQVFKNENPTGEINLGKRSDLKEERLWGIKRSTGAADAYLCQKWDKLGQHSYF